MRLATLWADLQRENAVLRIGMAVLGVTTIAFCMATVRLATREPVVIERECFTRFARKTDVGHRPSEIEAFAREALPKRFDTQTQDSNLYLSKAENDYRVQEQDEFKKKGIVQRVVVNQVSVNGLKVVAECDRILSTGNIKSVVGFPLELTMSDVGRNAANPYGLILSRVSQIKEEIKK